MAITMTRPHQYIMEQHPQPYETAFQINHQRNIVPDESLAIGQLLTREFLKLSTSDRTAIQEEIHGVRCLAVRETPEIIHKGLKDFQDELQKLPKDEKQTYEECQVRAMLYEDEEDSCYALHDEFKLRFLRIELFDAAKAVKRFVSYLDFVREHWGPEIALQRLIRFSDFTKAEMKLFRKGYFQVLPFRDHSGRRIISLLGGFDPEVDPVARTKAIFYLADVLTRTDVESQRRGVIFITEAYLWSVDDPNKRSRDSLRFPHPQEGLHYIKQLTDATAVRTVAIHNCWPDRPAFRIVSKLMTIHGMSGSSQKMRLKFHIGDELEMRYRLKSYGIPIELLPITESGSIKLINHNYWIKTRKQIEQGIDSTVTIVECPGFNDVVFRQGTSSMENPGNVKCRDLVLSLLENRDGSDASHCCNNEKFHNTQCSIAAIAATEDNDLVDELVRIIEFERFGHFLEWDKRRNAWTQMSDRQKIKQKVTVLFNSIDKRYRKTSASGKIGVKSIKNAMPSTVSSSNIKTSTVNSSNIISDDSSASRGSGTSSRNSPSILLQQEIDAMAIKSDEEAEMDRIGPYSFLEGGNRSVKQQQCCGTTNVRLASPQVSRKKLRKL